MKRSIVTLIVLVAVLVLAFSGTALAYRSNAAPDLQTTHFMCSAEPGFWNISVTWNKSGGRPAYFAVSEEFKSGGMAADWHELSCRQQLGGRLVITHVSTADVLTFQVGLSNDYGTDWGTVVFVP